MRPAGQFHVLAPGKALLVGEYAVLHGATAVVIAVDRWVRLAPCEGPSEGLVATARTLAARRLGFSLPRGGWAAASDAFRCDGRKLGLGSSAAVAVAAVASVWAEAGVDVEQHGVRLDMWTTAREAHDAHQGARGSGADVAASLFGGGLAVRIHPGAAIPAVTRWAPPSDLHLAWVWTGCESSTPELLQRVSSWQAAAPSAWAGLLARMDAAGALVASARDALDVVEGLRRYGELMAELGHSASAGIVTTPVARIMRAAERCGGAAKPSGAGGGDIVVAAFADGADAERFLGVVAAEGALPVPLEPAPRGVHLEGDDR